MIVKCNNCGKEILTEADTFIYQHRYNEEYYSCGCEEGITFNKPKALSIIITDVNIVVEI